MKSLTKFGCWSLVVFVALGILAACFAAAQCEGGAAEQGTQDITQPEWVCIFTLVSKPLEPVMEFRILIHAKSEGEAVMKSTVLIQRTFGITALDLLEFKEAGSRSPKK
jgi:hypothetical protein